MQDLKSCEGKSILTFNDSSTRPCETLDLLVSFDKRKNNKIVNMIFFVVPSENVYNYILKRSFLEKLDIIASIVNLNMKYHNDFG